MHDSKNQETCQTLPLFAVYVIWCRITNMHYVGITRRKVEQRICEHKRGKQYVDREIQRLGWEGNFDWWITESHIPANLITEREQYWIDFFGSIFPNGYNKTCGGIRYFEYSEETREAMHQSHLGKHHTEDTLAKMRSRHLSDETKAILSESRMGEKNPMYGKPSPLKGKHHTEEAKEKNRKAHLGKVPWNKGIPMPEETKAKIRKTNHGRKGTMEGKHHTEATKAILREKALARNARKRAAKAAAEENRAAAYTAPTNLSDLLDAVIL